MNSKAREPAIHKKELFNIINAHSKSFSNLSIDEVIVNIRLLRNKIMLADYKNIYRKNSLLNIYLCYLNYLYYVNDKLT